MDETLYLFIDGGYLRKAREKFFEPVFGDTLSLNYKLVMTVRRHPHQLARRAFYYDCIDNHPRKKTDGTEETPEELAARIRLQEERLEQIEAVPGMHVREGYLTKPRGKKRRVQKQVDVLLAVDMLNNAVRRNMTTAVLIAGDGDFVPVVQAVKEYGVYVILISDPENTAADLRRTADEHVPINWKRFCDWVLDLSDNARLYMETFPQRTEMRHPSHEAATGGLGLNRKGYILRDGARFEVSLRENQSGGSIYVTVSPEKVAVYSHTNPEIARRFAEFHEGPIIWTEGADRSA